MSFDQKNDELMIPFKQTSPELVYHQMKDCKAKWYNTYFYFSDVMLLCFNG